MREEGGHNGKTQLHALCDLTLAGGEGCISSFSGDVTSHVSLNPGSLHLCCFLFFVYTPTTFSLYDLITY